MPAIIMLGPQGVAPTLKTALDRLCVDGPSCIVTAGWREREGELEELEGLERSEITDLMLYHRADDVFHADPELFAAHRERQTRLKALQRLYRIKLGHAFAAATELSQAPGDEDLRRAEWRAAIAYIRSLDRQHLRAIGHIHSKFNERWNVGSRPAVRAHRKALEDLLGKARALLIAGGHIGVLLGRLRMFGIPDTFKRLPIVAWSAGAMVLSERLVLFHDHAPQGPNEAEVFEVGLKARAGLVPLPDARKRLNLADRQRVELFARRFAPAVCAVLAPDTILHWSNDKLLAGVAASRLTRTGRLRKLRAP